MRVVRRRRSGHDFLVHRLSKPPRPFRFCICHQQFSKNLGAPTLRHPPPYLGFLVIKTRSEFSALCPAANGAALRPVAERPYISPAPGLRWCFGTSKLSGTFFDPRIGCWSCGHGCEVVGACFAVYFQLTSVAPCGLTKLVAARLELVLKIFQFF